MSYPNLHEKLIAAGLPVISADDDGNISYSRDLTPSEAGLVDAVMASYDPARYAQALSAFVQTHINQAAQERGYTDALHCATYANSTILAWQAEGLAFVAWRDAVWLTAIEIMQACQQGERDVPLPGELMAELPGMVWP